MAGTQLSPGPVAPPPEAAASPTQAITAFVAARWDLVLRLGLLVNADAARAAQTATFLQNGPQSALGTVAVHLGALGESLVNEAKP